MTTTTDHQPSKSTSESMNGWTPSSLRPGMLYDGRDYRRPSVIAAAAIFMDVVSSSRSLTPGNYNDDTEPEGEETEDEDIETIQKRAALVGLNSFGRGTSNGVAADVAANRHTDAAEILTMLHHSHKRHDCTTKTLPDDPLPPLSPSTPSSVLNSSDQPPASVISTPSGTIHRKDFFSLYEAFLREYHDAGVKREASLTSTCSYSAEESNRPESVSRMEIDEEGEEEEEAVSRMEGVDSCVNLDVLKVEQQREEAAGENMDMNGDDVKMETEVEDAASGLGSGKVECRSAQPASSAVEGSESPTATNPSRHSESTDSFPKPDQISNVPVISQDCKISDHLSKFQNTPTHHGVTFDAFSLFAVVRELGGFHKIKSWSKLTRCLGFDTTRSNIPGRIKDWVERHHIRAFFDFLLGLKNEFYLSALPMEYQARPEPVLTSSGEDVRKTENHTKSLPVNLCSVAADPNSSNPPDFTLPLSPTSLPPNSVTRQNLLPLYETFLNEFHPHPHEANLLPPNAKYKNCRIQHHIRKFQNPPKHLNVSFDAYTLFAVMRGLGGGGGEVKSWTTVARLVGFEPRDSNIAARMKEWVRKHHVGPFFEYLMGVESGFVRMAGGARSIREKEGVGYGGGPVVESGLEDEQMEGDEGESEDSEREGEQQDERCSSEAFSVSSAS
ncbi:hypothetical protein HDV05_003186 [Chytridiales sp. JEL 0842]|nr:hypothetical protein HDV05_003186 [Chytridiales sp. JEL 0842]